MPVHHVHQRPSFTSEPSDWLIGFEKKKKLFGLELLKHGSLRRSAVEVPSVQLPCEGARQRELVASCSVWRRRAENRSSFYDALRSFGCTAETPLYVTQSKLLLLTACFSSQPTFCFKKKQTPCLPEFSFILCLGSSTLCGTRREIFRHLTLQCQQEISGDSDQDAVKTKNRRATEL